MAKKYMKSRKHRMSRKTRVSKKRTMRMRGGACNMTKKSAYDRCMKDPTNKREFSARDAFCKKEAGMNAGCSL